MPRCPAPQTEVSLLLPLVPIRDAAEPGCLVGSADAVQLETTVLCEDGNPQILLEWNFPFKAEPDDGLYTCILNSW